MLRRCWASANSTCCIYPSCRQFLPTLCFVHRVDAKPPVRIRIFILRIRIFIFQTRHAVIFLQQHRRYKISIYVDHSTHRVHISYTPWWAFVRPQRVKWPECYAGLSYGEEEGGRIKPKGFVLFREPKWVRFQILFAQVFGSAGMGDGGEGGEGGLQRLQ